MKKFAYIFWRTKKKICNVTLLCKDSTIISKAIEVFDLSIASRCSDLFSRKWPLSSISISCIVVSHLELLSGVNSNNLSSSKVASTNCHTFEKVFILFAALTHSKHLPWMSERYYIQFVWYINFWGTSGTARPAHDQWNFRNSR